MLCQDSTRSGPDRVAKRARSLPAEAEDEGGAERETLARHESSATILCDACDLTILRNHHSHVCGSWSPAAFEEACHQYTRSGRLVEAWAEIHHAELLDDWRRLQSGQPPLKIAPLR
jgi:hypothetical protein